MSIRTAAALLVLTCPAALQMAGPAPASAQVPDADEPRGAPMWSLFDAVGYGGLGFGIGFMMAPKDLGSIGAGAAMIAAGGVAGLVIGARLGRRAEAAVERGEEITPGHRTGVVGGVVLAGATLGAVASIPLLNNQGPGTALGSDEQTVGILVLAGSALGALYVWRNSDGLAPKRVDVAPAVIGGRQVGLGIHLRF